MTLNAAEISDEVQGDILLALRVERFSRPKILDTIGGLIEHARQHPLRDLGTTAIIGGAGFAAAAGIIFHRR